MKKIKSGTMSRRNFMILSCGALGGLRAIGLSDPQKAQGSIPDTSVKATTRVALVRCDNRKAGVRKAIELLKINPCQGKDVLLKPNFNTSDPTPGSTHNDVLRELLQMIKDMGAKKLSIGDRSGPEPTAQVLVT